MTSSIASPVQTEDVAEKVSPIPTQEDVVALIKRDAARCDIEVSNATAIYIDEMMASAVGIIRRTTPQVYILNEDDMAIAHDTLDAIMEDDVLVAKPGSAHEALNRRHLDGNEMSLVHTWAESRGANARYCAVVIGINSADA
jgi:hypothetical protein